MPARTLSSCPAQRPVARACRGFFIFLLTCVALAYNLIAVIIAVCAVKGFTGTASAIILAVIYFLVGIPGAWVLWYQRLYKGMISDGAVRLHAECCRVCVLCCGALRCRPAAAATRAQRRSAAAACTVGTRVEARARVWRPAARVRTRQRSASGRTRA
jgi:SCAMP family